MAYYIVIREAVKSDTARQGKLFRNSVMSYSTSAFLMFLFKEITLELTVLMSAIMFIFVGVPLMWCVLAIPIVAIIVYLLTYTTLAFKAAEKCELRPNKSWVAEAYEPFFLNTDPINLKYIVIDLTEAQALNSDLEKMRKKIVGTVSITDFHGPNNSAWLYGLAVDPGYRRRGIARKLVNAVLEYCKKENLESVELVTSDLHDEARQLFLNSKFSMRQMYHKQILGTLLTIGMYHQGCSLNNS